jgi:hypothetical protein
MFATLCGFVPADRAYPDRTRTLDILTRVLNGTLYDVLPFDFYEERGAGGEYVPLRSRRPSVRYPLARIVVEDSLALVFSEGHFPTIDSPDRDAARALADIATESNLNQVMLDAALRGAVGSVAIQLRVLRGRIFFRVLDTMFLTPEWDPQAPDELLRVTERYKVAGASLVAQGYAGIEPGAEYWFAREWDATQETWFLPQPVSSPVPAAIDQARTVRHGLGFVPLVWIRNLPGGDGIDGGCTFRTAVETSIEIDYQLSQAGRGLKYSSDPLLLIREPSRNDNDLIRGGGNALVVSERGDAKMLEINGAASAAVVDYVRTLREFALEGVHGNRANPDRVGASQSGRAMEMMNQGLLWLADNLRVSYGGGLLGLARMIIRASNLYSLRTHGEPVPPIDPATRLNLKWPRWYAPTADDRNKDAQTLSTLAAAGQISTETALKSIADVYDIADVPAELARIRAQKPASQPPTSQEPA